MKVSEKALSADCTDLLWYKVFICEICGFIDFEFRVELRIVLLSILVLSILVLNIPVLNIPVSNPLSERNLGFFEVTVDGLG
jgi:hypothetical protein